MNFNKNQEQSIFLLLIIVFNLSIFCTKVNAQEKPQKLIPFDAAIKTGKLSNGFTYYIKKNTEPKHRVTLYLVVKAGSILEDENQLGLAHFMEHMSFNGTKHFPKNELVAYLQKSGIRFGADLNAYTGFDETVYQLPIPTDNAEILKNGMQIIRDWAQDATLDPEEIDRERGVVLEEKRLRGGAQQRVQEQTLPALLNYSKYAKRLPIGTEVVLKNFTPAVIRSFYKDWYRPDLQAIIVVGDIDMVAIEKEVIRLFSDLKMPGQPRKRNIYNIALDGKNKFKTVIDPELSETTVEFLIKHKEKIIKNETDFKETLIRNLFSKMFAARLAESSKRPDAPFMKLQGGYGELMGGLNALSVSLIPRKGELEAGLKAGWTEVDGIRRNGFVQTELSRMKQELMSEVEVSLREKDKQNSTALADQYKVHFLKGQAVPGIEKEYALVKKFLPEITLAQLNAAAKAMIKATDRDVIITAPMAEKNQFPSQHTVYAWLQQVQQSKIKPYTETKSSLGLMTNLPLKGSITAEKQIANIGVTEWTLSNGAKVVLKPTNYKNDEIVFLSLSPGGTSLYNNVDYESAASAAGIIASFGLGDHDNIGLPKLLNGKQVSMQPFIADRVEGLQGVSTVKDLRTAMELVHLYFTAPRKDTALFRTIIRNSAQQISGRYTDPNNVFADTISAVLGAYNLRRAGPSLEKLNSITLDKVSKIYKERFADAGDFTFFFVGSFNPDTLRLQVEQCLASLPSSGVIEQAKDLGIRTPKGKISKVVKAGKEDKATVKLVFTGDYEFNAENNLSLSALKEILQFRLTERLREVEGGVYTPGVLMNRTKYPASRYSFTVNFGCAPANVEKLIAATLDELKQLRENGISPIDLQKFKAEQIRQNELMEKSNSFWLNYLSSQYLDGEDPKAFLKANTEIEQLNVGTLQQAAKKYLNEDNYIRFVLLPKQIPGS
ncbi:peptidase M16 [Pedobacter ginsengisoli]|uniref:Peptidase M16 n=1 Tax=Pedobacter ginsengisoli TaxID=363852 RepID=A0A2D1U3U6_9SPHI|nr:M16 family metallopeptidase [Pedobacter ginsengisoli]ATP56265.1 peptidase M16 [Pedobacter ginsengisoli]